LLLATILAPLALLLTPYAAEILRTLWQSPQFGEASGEFRQLANLDWKATTLAGYPGYFKAMAAAGVLLALNWRHVAMRDLLLLGGLAFMGVKLERHTPFFFFALAAVLPIYADRFLQKVSHYVGTIRWVAQGEAAPRPYILCALLFLSLLLAIQAARPAWRNYGFFAPGLRAWHYPVAEAKFVRTQRLPGNIYNTYGIGGYLMWTLFPDYRVFWVSRQDSADMFALGMQVKSGQPGWEQVLERFQVNTLILEACSQADGSRFPLIDRVVNHREWALVQAGESHLVFVRRTAVAPEWLQRFELPAERVSTTIMAAAYKMLQESPLRPQALWEVARGHLARREFGPALNALTRYRQVTSPQMRPVEAEAVYQQLSRIN
jgi:hypothetical protein